MNQNQSEGIYVHFPFCRSRCHYCSFISGWKNEPEMIHRYLNDLKKEIILSANQRADRAEESSRFQTLYFGGGTPSLMNPEQIYGLKEKIRDQFGADNIVEITLEGNPEDFQDSGFAIELIQSGVNRISLGFQSMNDQTLSFIGRVNRRKSNLRAFENLRKAGFQNISIDLISGINGDDFYQSLHEVLGLFPEHLSVYLLSIEQGTEIFNRIQSGAYSALDEDQQGGIYLNTIELCEKNGLNHYEISNFARGKKNRSKHNQLYWNDSPYTGLGIAASGYVKRPQHQRIQNCTDLEEYRRRLEKNELPGTEIETLNHQTVLKEWLMLRLRTTDGFINDEFQYISGVDFEDLIDHSYLHSFFRFQGRRISLKREIFPVYNRLMVELWSLLDDRNI